MSEGKERIKISAFVEKYKQLASEQSKDKYVKEHIVTTYSPILNKKYILEAMNEKSEANGPTGKYIDFVVSKLNLIMAILVLYTDIEPDKDEDGKALTWEAYDLLKSTGLYEKILGFIGKDIEELMSIQSNILETWHLKNASTEAYISHLVEQISHKFSLVAGAGMGKLADVLDDDAKIKKIEGAFEKVMKKIK